MEPAEPASWAALRVAVQQGYKYFPTTGVFIGKSGNRLTIKARGTKPYPTICLHVEGLPKPRYTVHAHKFAGFVLFGEVVLGLDVRHLDGNPLNFLGVNLAVGTKHQNEMDKPPALRSAVARIARAAQPKRSLNAKLSEAEELTIRKELNLNRTSTGRVRRGVVKRLSFLYGVSPSLISIIGKDKSAVLSERNRRERAARLADRIRLQA